MERGVWGGKLEFLLTCIGYAVGLGNVWRFPYLLFRNGGGAFLIPFILMLILIGIPIFYMEINLGQFTSIGPLGVWKSSPLFKGLGYSMIFTNILVAMYYNVIVSWCLYYFFSSFTINLPWENCGNNWNTEFCSEFKEFQNMSDESVHYISKVNISKFHLKTPSEEYFYRKVLRMSDGINNFGNIVWQLALCLLLVWIIVFLVLIRGIASLGKVVYITSTFPYALLTIMLIKGATLEGASDGIKYYLFPDFSKLYDLKIWSDAATQIFYALSACTGGLIAMASYNNFNNNTTWDSLIVPISNILTSIYAGFVIFSVLGYMANLKGVSIEDVAADGPGLVFVVYPEGLSTMTAAPLWSMLFFLMMIMLGLSSMFSMVECFFIALMDEFPDIFLKYQNSVIILRGLSIVVFYFMSLPMISNGGFYIFSLVDSYAGGFPLLIIGLLEITVISYIYGLRNFEDDIRMMIGKKPSKCFRYSWNIISPLIILVTIIAMSLSYRPPSLFNNTYIYPYWAEIFGWSIITFCLAFIPAYFVFYIAKDVTKILIQASKPLRTWGPAQERHRTGRYLTCCQEISQF